MKEKLKVNREKCKFNKFNGITLISLVITIVVLIILASVGIYLSLGNNGIFTRAKQANETTNKQTATEIINLKITNCQMNKYAEEQRMPTLKELSLVLGNDNEIQYVTQTSKVASVEYDVPSENPESIYTKLNQYPYEFEINSSLQLASIDGVQIAQGNNSKMSVLWENPNDDTVAFNSQIVELANDKYDYIEILYKNITVGNLYYVEKVYKGYNTLLTHLYFEDTTNFTRRVVNYVDETHLKFEDGYEIKYINNNCCVPVKIIGYRY